jgi:hypothetical protein
VGLVADLPFLQPFVLPVPPVAPVSAGGLDLYLPRTDGPAPAVVLVHGGPVPAALPQRPPSWPAYRGYGSLLARAGVVGVMFEHGYRTPGDVDAAAADVRGHIEEARAHPAVDSGRLVLWFFSGGGVLSGEWLADPPPWLAGVALTYPMLAHWPGVTSPLVTPVSAGAPVPVLLTRVEHEMEVIVPSQQAFLAANPGVEVVEVPGAHHGFETIDDTDAARTAIRSAVTWAVARVS